MKNRYEAVPGEVLHGKWTGHKWRVDREIGRGANGVVYLVTGAIGQAALKFAGSSEVASETNTLKSLERVRGASPGPFFIEADDVEKDGVIYPFYIMEYIDGMMLHTFMRSKKEEWSFIILIRLLDFLAPLHQSGKIMGDLKPENFIVSGSAHTIRAVDMGGITKQGRSVKEYTSLYDRAAWHSGSREAEPAYDLFAASVLTIALVHKKEVQAAAGQLDRLISIIESSPVLRMAAPILKNALHGQYDSAMMMKKELLICLSGREPLRRSTKKKKKSRKWPVLFIILTVIIFLFFVTLKEMM
ncbi:protein kinase domain-containing protein [Domibacillus antri]|nr:serine/threonine-protein kinase [Domibacillus antri]